MARFELALSRVKWGDPGPHVVAWAHEPYTVLEALINGRPFEEERTGGAYQTVVSRAMPPT